MKILRFMSGDNARYGLLARDGKTVELLENDPFSGSRLIRDGKTVALSRVQLLAPCAPTKIVAAGLNYRDHAREMGMKIPAEPCIFLKAPSALIAHTDPILLPAQSRRVDFEAELAFVIKKTARNVPVSRAAQYILGYTSLNDVTARDLQKRDGQWARAKSFDTFCPVGPWIETRFDLRRNPAVRLYLNGELRQSSSTENFIFSPARILSFVSRVMTLFPGDIVSTGTPGGIGPMRPGDVVRVEIGGLAPLENPVAAPRR